MVFLSGREIKNILGLESEEDENDLCMNQISLSAGEIKTKKSNLNLQYQLLMQKYFQSRNDNSDAEINAHRLIQTFTQICTKKFIEIIDSYHNYPKRRDAEDLDRNTLLFQDNEVTIRLIVDYETADDDQIKMAEDWMRQEMNALRWINSKCTNPSIHTSLMTILQYKGFRAIAQATIPVQHLTMTKMDSAIKTKVIMVPIHVMHQVSLLILITIKFPILTIRMMTMTASST